MNIDSLLVVVPARGGSKGLPRKNALMLGDIPLLGWTAEAFKKSKIGNSICLLSTDDAEIAEIGRSVGLEVPFMRPSSLGADTTSAEDVALHALDWVQTNRKFNPDAVMLLQPTSPFRTPSLLGQAKSLMSKTSSAGIIGVKAIYRTQGTLFYADGDMVLQPLLVDRQETRRRQEVNPIYTPNGAMYLVQSDVLRKSKCFVPTDCRGILMSQIESLDIDDSLDMQLAEALVASGMTWRDNL